LLPASAGVSTVLGTDSRQLTPELRARVGYVPEDHPLYRWMTVKQLRDFQAAFYPKWQERIFREVLDQFGFNEAARVKHLSRGERAGLSLALSLAPDPDVLIMDDPALGVDPVARRNLMEMMVQMTRRRDRTIVFSSHDLADVERVADWLAVLENGVLRVHCRVETFRERVREFRLEFDRAPALSIPLPGLIETRRESGVLRVTCTQPSTGWPDWRSLGARRVEETPLSLEESLIRYLRTRPSREVNETGKEMEVP
jgi:ABC-2 type transport system ATP-binding protein